jgi:hypothetical protein
MMHAMLRLAVFTLVAAVVVVPVSQAGTVRRSVPEADMSFAIPGSWRVVDARSAATAAVKALAKENPQLAAILQQVTRPDSVIKFFAFDPALASSFATNANVVVSPIPTNVTLQQYLAAARSEISALPGRVGAASTRIVTLPAGTSVRSNVKIGLVSGGKRIVAEVTQWAFLRQGQSVVVSFTTTPSRQSRYAPTFTAAARSIRFG